MKVFKKILLGILVFVAVVISYFSIGSAPQAKEITWGVNFSQRQAEYLGLDWQGAYSALIDDFGVRKIKIITHWDLIEPQEEEYNFADLDWQIEKAEQQGAEVFLVIGLKTGRWPECHEPYWVKNQKSNLKKPTVHSLFPYSTQQKLLDYLERVVNRYKDSPAIWAWQIENEPFFPFGECSIKKDLLKKEINLVKSLDPERPIIISDSGEFSFWITAARLGDIVSATLHRRVWFEEIKTYITYPFRPVFYWKKSQIIRKFFDKEVFVGELQAEPWCPEGIADCSIEEQRKTMDLDKFLENIEFAKKTGLSEFYLWGAEWWYWLQEKQNDPAIWNEARKLFTSYN